jgi:HK97 family phage prohead protease
MVTSSVGVRSASHWIGSTPIPLVWMRKADNTRGYVGDVVEATETDDGLAITGRFDRDTEFGKSAYRNTKGRRVSGLSIGYAIRNSTKTAAGNELTDLESTEVSIVAWRPMTEHSSADAAPV